MRISRDAVARPGTETDVEPVLGRFRPIRRDRFPQHCGARFALLGRLGVEPFDVLIGQIGKDAGH